VTRLSPNPIAAFNALLRKDFASFLHKTVEELNPGVSFQTNWHINAIDHALGQMMAGEMRRLIVNLPPRHLKSLLISVAWVAWQLGQDPSLKFICVSYNNDLAANLHRLCRRVMEADWYKNVFPHTRLLRATDTELETSKGGSRFATSVGGTLTGRGADIIVIDDPMKAEDAQSETARSFLIEWYASTLVSRLNDKLMGKVILVQQRLHEDDLSGHLLEQGGWHHLNFPAIADDDQKIPVGPNQFHLRKTGEVLHPEREPQEALDQLKRELGSHVFTAQYQQMPVPAGGHLIERKWVHYYDDPIEPQPGDTIIQSWDTASKTGPLNDWSVCVTALVRRGVVYVLDVYRAKLKFPDLLRMVEEQARTWQARKLLIEDAASGTQLIQHLYHNDPRGVPQPSACTPDGDKISRMAGHTARLEAAKVLFPRNALWLADFLHELLAFPFGRHDDQVDALAQLLHWQADNEFEFLQLDPDAIFIPKHYDDLMPWQRDALDTYENPEQFCQWGYLA
jgi:predicted phage terminase large subunit-like protein